MFSSHFYNATLKRTIAVFGSIFNNITVVKRDADDRVVQTQRVPLSYGPKEKYLTRIDEQKDLEGNKVAIKLPRMSFEMTGLIYDPQSKLGRVQQVLLSDPVDPAVSRKILTHAPYRLLVQLSILSKTQDEALQILEQILPYFQPEYSVTVESVDGSNLRSDLPITLTGLSLSDSFEGTALDRRAVIFTLDFELRVKFFGPLLPRKLIKVVDVRLSDKPTMEPLERIRASVNPATAEETDTYEILTGATFIDTTTDYRVSLQSGAGFYTVGETVVGDVSGMEATVASFDSTTNMLMITGAAPPPRMSETITGETSACSRTVGGVTPTFA